MIDPMQKSDFMNIFGVIACFHHGFESQERINLPPQGNGRLNYARRNIIENLDVKNSAEQLNLTAKLGI